MQPFVKCLSCRHRCDSSSGVMRFITGDTSDVQINKQTGGPCTQRETHNYAFRFQINDYIRIKLTNQKWCLQVLLLLLSKCNHRHASNLQLFYKDMGGTFPCRHAANEFKRPTYWMITRAQIDWLLIEIRRFSANRPISLTFQVFLK